MPGSECGWELNVKSKDQFGPCRVDPAWVVRKGDKMQKT